jgi:insulysin
LNNIFLRAREHMRAIVAAAVVSGLLLVSACQSQSPDDSAPSPSKVGSTEVRKSPNDSRDYRYLTLSNELRVLLVSDPDTDKSAAAMAVYRGSFHEPEDRPGLAHFLEHMLFIQTEAFPEPGAFQKFVAANGGSTNAYTALDHTNYFFNVQPTAFPEALERWAHFFIKPIISAEYSEREKNAVNSEFQMQMKDDGWRGYMVGKQALNQNHPAANFTIGSLETLAGDIQADLVDFFETQYSSDQMGLVLLSNTSLDELEAKVLPLFSQITNKKLGSRHVSQPMYTPEQLPQLVTNQTFKQGAALTFAFPLPSTLQHYRKKPEQYFANLIGHEGAGSLYQYLSSQGWVESLGAGVSVFDRGTSVLNVNMSLTPAGDQQHEAVAQALFSYIDLVSKTPPQEWLYKEQATVAELAFRFQEKSSPTGLVYQLAPRLDHYPASDLLVAPSLMEEFDAALISQYLGYLNPENVVVEYTSPNVEGNKIEPWFKVPFAIEAFDFTPGDVALPFKLPATNPFLPAKLNLVADDGAPIAAVGQPGLQLWLDTDTSFGTPRSSLHLELAVPGGLVSPADRAQAQLYSSLVQDALSELVYPAYLAGLSYQLSVPDAGFEIRVTGYTEKQNQLLIEVLNTFLSLDIDPNRFTVLKASMIKDWDNSTRERPYSQTYAALSDTLRSGRWPRQLLTDALTDVTVAELTQWRADKLQRFSINGLLHGNVDQQYLATLVKTLRSKLPISSTPIPPLRPTVRDITGAFLLEVPVDHNDASMILHTQDDDASFASRAQSLLTAQMLQPEYFRQLRTEQQLGYVVSANARAIVDRGGITFIVQSPSASAAKVEQATLDFVREFKQQTIDPANFTQQKSGLISQLLEKPKNLGEKSQRYWSDLSRDLTSFDSREQIADHVLALEIEDIEKYLSDLENRLTDKRLLIYNKGKFPEVPTHGTKLSSPIAEFTSE